LAPAETATGTLTHTVVEGDLPGPIVNEVEATGYYDGDPVTDTDTASVTLAVGDLSNAISRVVLQLDYIIQEGEHKDEYLTVKLSPYKDINDTETKNPLDPWRFKDCAFTTTYGDVTVVLDYIIFAGNNHYNSSGQLISEYPDWVSQFAGASGNATGHIEMTYNSPDINCP